MKNFLLCFINVFFVATCFATQWPVTVTSNQFTPANINVNVGDTITYTFVSGTHNVTSVVLAPRTGMVPAGATDLNSGSPSSTPRVYQYIVKVAGDYRYYCQVHSPDGTTGMVGFFTASDVLPISLQNFAASLNKNNVLVSWQTTLEDNVAYFAVNRSLNGVQFTELAQVKAEGNSTTINNYRFTDDNISSSNAYIYYSLAAVDKDGKKSLSPIVMVKNTLATKKLITNLSPNPISKPGHLMIQFNADAPGKLLATVYDATGKKILEDDMSAVAGLNNGHLHLGDVPPGVYNIVFSIGNVRETYKVVVQ